MDIDNTIKNSDYTQFSRDVKDRMLEIIDKHPVVRGLMREADMIQNISDHLKQANADLR